MTNDERIMHALVRAEGSLFLATQTSPASKDAWQALGSLHDALALMGVSCYPRVNADGTLA